MIRTFLAVELHEPLRTSLEQIQQGVKQRLNQAISRDVRMSWVRPTSMHLTVKFLGDIDEQLVLPMQEVIKTVVSAYHAIHVPLDRLGVFPRIQQPRVLWVGPSEQWEHGDDAKRLASLHRDVEACCGTLNLAMDERPLSPHLTLARIKEGGRSFGQVLAKSGVMDWPLTLGPFVVASIALMKSELKPTGSVYTKLWDAKLG